MYIEDLIKKIATSGIFCINVSPNFEKFVSTKEFSILMSFSDQLDMGNSLTEKQSHFAIRILEQNKDAIYGAAPEVIDSLADPKWKLPFRTLLTSSQISIEECNESQQATILVGFPYSVDIINTLREKNSNVHEQYRGSWDPASKAWSYQLTEKSILFLGDTLLPQQFSADEKFLDLYKRCCEIRQSMEDYIPMVACGEQGYYIKNGHKSIPQPTSDSLIETLFFARKYGITVWDDNIEAQLKDYQIKSTVKFLTSSRKDRVWLDSNSVDISEFTDLLKYGGSTIVMVPGGSELQLTKKWVNFALSIGIDISDMSVMFRLPNNNAQFNEYVKTTGLNNPVNENTKIVFVSTKITKPLIKAGLKFSTVINLGYYNYMHYSMNTIVDNISNLVYYSMKAPTDKRWQPHEL